MLYLRELIKKLINSSGSIFLILLFLSTNALGAKLNKNPPIPNTKVELDNYINKHHSFSEALISAAKSNNLILLNRLLVSRGIPIEIKQIIKGPVSSDVYFNTFIFSDTVGLFSSRRAVVSDSIIIAPICVVTDGLNLDLTRNYLICNLCVEFERPGFAIGVKLINNHCEGQLTNSIHF